MMNSSHHCPACGRPFKSILDYPAVRIVSFKRLPIPEAMDQWSAPATEKRLARQRARGFDSSALLEGGINMTPAIARACKTREVEEYLTRLSMLPGQEVAPHRLLPAIKPDGRFRWAYPVADTCIYISLADAARHRGASRSAEVQVHCDGPNLGSAGGPTLQPLGAIARLRYQGLLAKSMT